MLPCNELSYRLAQTNRGELITHTSIRFTSNILLLSLMLGLDVDDTNLIA
jgi:hypothetical protein